MDNISKYLTVTLFAAFAGKVIWFGNPTIAETASLLGLGVISFVYQYYTNNKEIVRLEERIDHISSLYEAKLERHEQLIKDTTTSIASVKIGTGMTTRRVSNG